jgi:hypothetical protein
VAHHHIREHALIVTRRVPEKEETRRSVRLF